MAEVEQLSPNRAAGLCLSVPGGEGPVPAPTSYQHANLFPELEVRGGMKTFAHDAGMVWGSPTWTLAGKPINDFSREMLPALFEHRGITTESPTTEKAALAMDFYLAYRAYGVLLEEPSEWKGLHGKKFHPPTLEIGSETIWNQQVEVAMIYYWTMKQRKTDNPEFVWEGRDEIQNFAYEPDESKLDHWLEWERKCAKIRLTRKTDFKYGDHYTYQLGYVITEIPCSGKCSPEESGENNDKGISNFCTTIDGSTLFFNTKDTMRCGAPIY